MKEFNIVVKLLKIGLTQCEIVKLTNREKLIIVTEMEKNPGFINSIFFKRMIPTFNKKAMVFA